MGLKTVKDENRDYRARFSYWFKNIYWYHYKWHTLIGIAVLIMAVTFIYDMLSSVTPDFQFVVASRQYISDESIENLSEIARNAFLDTDPDSPAIIQGHSIYYNEQDQMGIASMQKFAVMMADDSVSFFIIDGDIQKLFFTEPVGFFDLGELGFRTAPGMPWLADLTGMPQADNLTFPGNVFYAVIRLPRNAVSGVATPDPRQLAFLENLLNN